MIARILHGGMVAQQGLLHVGDIIKEVNGQPVGSDPRALQELLRSASGSVILKILPSYQEPHLPRQVGPSAKVPTQHKAQEGAEPQLSGSQASWEPLFNLSSKQDRGRGCGAERRRIHPQASALFAYCTCTRLRICPSLGYSCTSARVVGAFKAWYTHRKPEYTMRAFIVCSCLHA